MSSRNETAAAIEPERIAPVATRSIFAPAGVVAVTVPTPRVAGSAEYCASGLKVPRPSKARLAAAP